MTKRLTFEEVVDALMAGEVGVLPTDTVYGLVARASDPQAVAKLYELKHRERKPGTTVAANVEQLIELGVAEEHLQPVLAWWPGPLSVETPFSDPVTDLDQGTGHAAWRVVADDGLRAILEQTGPLLTSSANQPGEPGSVNLDMAWNYFGDQVDFYVDGGDLSERLPSTVIRVKEGQVELIRQGAVRVDVPQPGCPFCLDNGILNGEIMAESAGAFMIPASSVPGNFLIVPKVHIEDPAQLPSNWWGEMRELLPQLPQKGVHYNLALNIGKLSGQSLKHLHFWIVPRVAGKPASGKGLARLINDADTAE